MKESVRAKLRVLVKRVLRNHGYPPDKQQKATDTVLQQAELIAKPTLLASLITEADELVRIFASSIRTAQKNRRDT